MALTVKYTQAQYQAKITELEGYYAQLEQHLTRMQELKSQMFNFWDDPNAQTTGQILAVQIRNVQNAMDRTSDTLSFYKSAIEKLDGVNISVGDLLGDALSILGE